MPSPRLLILSFSTIASDARVRKQVELFRGSYEVTTCGFGPAPEGVAEHVEIPQGLSGTDLDGRLITARAYRLAYWRTSAVAYARRVLPGAGQFDLVLANDVEAVPLALSLGPRRGVHADLHEYAPAQHDEIPSWRRRIAPFKAWLCRRYVTRAASVTTVGQGIADRYREQFGIDAGVVTNAAPYHALEPQPVGDEVRLVHSGVAQRKRHLEIMIEAVALTKAPVTLDLFLVPNDPAYLDELRAQVDQQRDGRVRLHPPVPYDELIPTLNSFDVGLIVLPPVNFNKEWSLPNKLFDYVQARLGSVVGPSPEMAVRVQEWGVGAVAPDFTSEGLARVLDGLAPEGVRRYKAAAHARARELSSESEVLGWKSALERLGTDAGSGRR